MSNLFVLIIDGFLDNLDDHLRLSFHIRLFVWCNLNCIISVELRMYHIIFYEITTLKSFPKTLSLRLSATYYINLSLIQNLHNNSIDFIKIE